MLFRFYIVCLFLFFLKQKTAYELKECDWSSDVCSSDLRIILERDDGDVIPFHCRHCTEAPCITVCPTQAMFRLNESSPVILDKAKCIGCNACVIVCPFGVIKKGSDGKSLIKCDLCIHRLREGEEPACAEACPTHAIRYISIEQISEERRKDALRKYRVALIQNNDGDAVIG